VPFAFFADLFFPQNAPHTSALLVAEQGFDKWTQELRLTSEVQPAVRVDRRRLLQQGGGLQCPGLVITPAEPLFFANFPSDYEEVSVFATGTWYFTPDFDASFGIRYSDYSNDVELVAVGPLVAPLP
jgi:iron complex outermembrane recepter protein